MLVLSRKVGERIVLPELGVTVTVLGKNGKNIRLGIEAPPDVSVHREEVWLRVNQFACAEAAMPGRTPNEPLT